MMKALIFFAAIQAALATAYKCLALDQTSFDGYLTDHIHFVNFDASPNTYFEFKVPTKGA